MGHWQYANTSRPSTYSLNLFPFFSEITFYLTRSGKIRLGA
jgi:hypothetical protein